MPLLRAEPKQLLILVKDGKVLSDTKLELINVSDEVVKYKVKCTDVNKFSLSKSNGAIRRGSKDVISITLKSPWNEGRTSMETFCVVFSLTTDQGYLNEVRIPCYINSLSSTEHGGISSEPGGVSSSLRHRGFIGPSGDQDVATFSFPSSSHDSAPSHRPLSEEHSFASSTSLSSSLAVPQTGLQWTVYQKVLFTLFFSLSTFVLLLPSPGLPTKEVGEDMNEFSVQVWLVRWWPQGLRPSTVCRCFSSFVLGLLVMYWFKT